MPPWLLYITGCIGFATAIAGGLGLYATFDGFDFDNDELWDFAKPAFLLLAGLLLFIVGWPS